MQRILFLYAKLNPGQSYVQGMNEIIGPIYYVLASDPNNEWRGNVLQFIFDLFQIYETVVKLIFIKLKIKRISLFFKCDELALALLRIKRTSSSREIFADFWVPHEIKSCDFQNLLVFGFSESSHHLLI